MENNSTESSTWKTVVGDRVILVESANPWYDSIKNNKCDDEDTIVMPIKKNNNNFLRILCFLMITIMILIILQLTMAKN